MSRKSKRLTCEVDQVFNDWTIVDNTPIIKNGHTYVLARCKCGREEFKNLSDLIHGRVKSCPNCAARKRSRNINIGDKYFDWEVIDGPISSENQCLLWLCRCKCGREFWIQGNELLDPTRRLSCRKCAIDRSKETFMNNKGKIGDLNIGKYNHIKSIAEKRDIKFDVSMEYLWNLYLTQEGKCAITGDDLIRIRDASLDRIDSSIGYIEGNVQWVTKQANICKHVLSMKELFEFCEKVLNHANQKPSPGLTSEEGSETST